MTFDELFIGATGAHGLWDIAHGAKTVREPTSPEDYARHLSGNMGLGLVPVREDGSCRFGAIDIDIDTINHQELYRLVTDRHMPLHVCRSKSGGAHLYLFIPEPGLPAKEVQDLLKRWASLLGYPTSEIFPKQVKVGTKNLGNWINLPYFAGNATTRYCVGPNGALSLPEFLASVVPYEGQAVSEQLSSLGDAGMPPCLQALHHQGLPEGTRNMGLFNFGVFFRKSDPTGWENKLVQFNQQHVAPVLPYRELRAIIGSLSRVKYQYLCDQEPIKAHCHREQCLLLPFGVGNMPWNERGSFDEILVSHLRKLTSDPPRYLVEVNGHDLELASEQFLNFQSFRTRVLEMLDVVAQPMKQQAWEVLIRDLLKTKEDIIAPDEASPTGQVLERFMEFLAHRDRARSEEDIIRGIPVVRGDRVLFRVQDFRKFLQLVRVDINVDNTWLFSILNRLGCIHDRATLLGKRLSCWSFPVAGINEQLKDFTPTREPGEDQEEI